MSSLRDLLRRRSSGQTKGGAEVGLLALVGLLIAGVLVGAGIAQSVLNLSDPLTWLAGKDGRITRVNPQTGKPVDRLPVASDGDDLKISQDDGVLIVTNQRTNEIVAIDLGMLATGGTRPGNPNVEVLLASGHVYLVDKIAGAVERVNPITAATLGRPWQTGGAISDAAVDGTGSLWLIDEAGQLVTLAWNDSRGEFLPGDRRSIDGASARSVLVSHERGVTVLDPNGAVVQAGTGRDRQISIPSIAETVVAAEQSPVGLVPASVPSVGSVLIVRGEDTTTVDTSGKGCRTPGKPVVYHDVIYVVCHGASKVIRLDASGRSAGTDIATPKPGEPELVLNGDVLIINAPGAATGLVIDPDGRVRTINTNDPRVPIHVPTAAPSGPVRSPDGQATGTPTPRRTGTGGVTPTTSPPGGGAGANPADRTPTNARAQARPDSSVQVSWTPARVQPGAYRVLRADTLQQVGTASAAQTFTLVTGLPLGQPIAFVVEAMLGNVSYRSQPSNPVVAFGRPGQPNISIRLAARSPSTVTLEINVDVVSDGASPVLTYDLSISSSLGRNLLAAPDLPIGQRPHMLVATCTGWNDLCLGGGNVDATASLTNAAGDGTPRTVNAAIPAPPAFNVNNNAPVMMVSAGGKCMHRSGINVFLQMCNNSAAQRWTPKNTGDLTSAVDNACLEHRQRTRLGFTIAGDDECRNREDSVRWVHVPASGNLRSFRGEGLSRCIAILGDVAGDFVAVNLQDCRFNDQDRWFLYHQQPGLPLAVGS